MRYLLLILLISCSPSSGRILKKATGGGDQQGTQFSFQTLFNQETARFFNLTKDHLQNQESLPQEKISLVDEVFQKVAATSLPTQAFTLANALNISSSNSKVNLPNKETMVIKSLRIWLYQSQGSRWKSPVGFFRLESEVDPKIINLEFQNNFNQYLNDDNIESKGPSLRLEFKDSNIVEKAAEATINLVDPLGQGAYLARLNYNTLAPAQNQAWSLYTQRLKDFMVDWKVLKDKNEDIPIEKLETLSDNFYALIETLN